ncbi:MAG: hypothetical protein KGO96_01950 [Elusimicrobia bacterium]|nr:hypothetical protein [Elusimicrobiota bacterium]MDE2236312.1 hypothetical protein [Elusimicrobiota bacterium]MDE2424658.1 hypothetical protein [Elusimicrobiota bacterium]
MKTTPRASALLTLALAWAAPLAALAPTAVDKDILYEGDAAALNFLVSQANLGVTPEQALQAARVKPAPASTPADPRPDRTAKAVVAALGTTLDSLQEQPAAPAARAQFPARPPAPAPAAPAAVRSVAKPPSMFDNAGNAAAIDPARAAPVPACTPASPCAQGD